ncbi:MAG: hypothetical protein K2I80_03055 [Ruminococcus sp.]|nr:hypothetical protein [Ruminococcus sp.]
MKNFDKNDMIFNKVEGHTRDTRILLEELGLIKKHRIPEKCYCPECGNKKTIYTWRHIVQTDMCTAIECYYCDFNALTIGLPVSHINEAFEEYKKYKKRK